MQYRTTADLSALVRANIHKVPHDIDIVVGVPRSGILPAMMIALYLNKRVVNLETFVTGRIVGAGEESQYISSGEIKKVLVVDDSVRTGSAINKAKQKIIDADFPYQYIYLSPIVSTEGKEFVDVYFEIIDDDRIFEWNLWRHDFMESSCLDIDGVINVDPKFETDDDGQNYIHFLQHAEPLFIPVAPVDTLISCRLEKYRTYTEEWLKRYHIQYKHLVMLDLPSKAARLKWNKHGLYKAQYYKEHKNLNLFIESGIDQAQVIADYTKKPVLCVETNSLVHANLSGKKKLLRAIKRKFPRMYSKIRRIFVKDR